MTAAQSSRTDLECAGDELRILVLAPTGRDGVALSETLAGAGLRTEICPNIARLCEQIGAGAGAAIIADEALDADSRTRLTATLADQPEWSDFPLIVMATHGVEQDASWSLLRDIGAAGHTVLVQRPAHLVTLLSAVRAALRSREHQYLVRDELAARRRAEEALRDSRDRLSRLNDTLEQRVSERTRDLHEQTERLRRLARQLVDAEQRERAKISATLHDGLQQILVAAKLRLGTFARRHADQPAEEIESLLDEAIGVSRSIAYELSPPALQDSGLADAVSWLARWFADHHDFHVEPSVDQPLPALDEQTRTLLFHALRELIFNAVKHSGVRRATVSVVADDRAVRAAVRDEGRGFNPDAIKEGCDGLGLFSIRERLEGIGGRLEATSAPGEGAEFVVVVPVGAEDAGVAPPPQPHATRRCTVLVADDHRIVREGVVALLQERDEIDVVAEATNGVEALQMAERHEPDVVLMDVNMPEMDGIEATRLLRQRLPGVHVIALSVHPPKDRADAMRNAGADAYVSKKRATEDLLRTIERVQASGA